MLSLANACVKALGLRGYLSGWKLDLLEYLLLSVAMQKILHFFNILFTSLQ